MNVLAKTYHDELEIIKYHHLLMFGLTFLQIYLFIKSY